MTTEQRRKEFEEWANLKDYSTAQYKDSDEYVNDDTTTAWEAWQAAIQKEQDEYCPLSDPNHPHGIRFREDSPTPRTDEVNLVNSSLEDALRFADENNTTGGLLTMAALKTLEVGCRELTAVTKKHDVVVLELRRVDNQLTAITEQRDRLAQALENCREDSIELLGERDWWQLENRGDYQQRYQTTRDNVTHADAALQSLNQNKQ